jgi:hypothetical protein
VSYLIDLPGLSNNPLLKLHHKGNQFYHEILLKIKQAYQAVLDQTSGQEKEGNE